MAAVPITCRWQIFTKYVQEHYKQFLALIFSIILTVLIVVFRNDIIKLSSWGYLGVFLIDVLGNATVLFPVPSIAVNFASGSVLNPWIVGLVAGVAEPIGELSGYLAGYGGSVAIENRPNYAKVMKWMNKRGFITLIALSAFPNPIFDLAGMTAGAMRFPVWKFLFACWIGKTIKATGIAFLGSGLLPFVIQVFS